MMNPWQHYTSCLQRAGPVSELLKWNDWKGESVNMYSDAMTIIVYMCMTIPDLKTQQQLNAKCMCTECNEKL